MGLLSKAQMRDQLWLSLDTRPDVAPQTDGGTPTSESRLDAFLETAYQHVQLPHTFEHVEKQSVVTVTLATGTASYTITNVYAIDHVRYVEAQKLLPPRNREQLSNMRDQSGAPTSFARWGNNLFLDRTPTATENGHRLDIYCWTANVALATSPASILRPEWDEIILQGAAWRGWLVLGDLKRADFHRENYAALINDQRTVQRIEGRTSGWQTEVPMTEYMKGGYGR